MVSNLSSVSEGMKKGTAELESTAKTSAIRTSRRYAGYRLQRAIVARPSGRTIEIERESARENAGTISLPHPAEATNPMLGSRSGRGRTSHSLARERQAQPWLAKALNPASLLPGMVIGFLLGLWVEFPRGVFWGSSVPARKGSDGSRNASSPSQEGGELKMVFVVRQDLKMGSGKIASQCAHAATGIYNELLSRNRALLKRWEDCGQPKIVVTCKNQKEMNELRGKADGAGLPTYTVADAGRTQVAAGSKTVLVIGPGSKASIDSVTRHLRLL